MKEPAHDRINSSHLKQLTDASLITRERRGTYSYSRLAPALEQCATLVCGQPSPVCATPQG
jgi:DNA-binding transcriptional ArsR family regulator